MEHWQLGIKQAIQSFQALNPIQRTMNSKNNELSGGLTNVSHCRFKTKIE